MSEQDRIEEERGLRSAILRGETVAWEVLYRRTFDVHARWVRRRTAGRDDLAQEVISESWMVAVRGLRRFDPARASFASWLRGIAARVLADRVRLEARRTTSSLTGDLLGAADPDIGSKERIGLALGQLPADYRSVLHAKYVERQTVEEIAEATERSAKAVESLLSRARAAFRVAYGRL